MKKLYLFLALCFSLTSGFGQCPVINGAMVNSCADGNNEGTNEFVVFTTTAQAAVSAYTLYYGSNNPPTNSTTGRLLGSNASAKTSTGSFITTNGCSFTQVTSSSVIIPANSTVIFIPADFTQQYDITGLCNGSLYVVYINRVSNGNWSNSGTLANNPSGNRYIQVVNGSSSCTSGIRSYSSQWPSNNDGNAVWWNSAGTAQYANNGCAIITPPQELLTVTPINPQPFCEGTATAAINYISQGNPDRYSLSWNATALAAGFVNVQNAVLNPSVIQVSIPQSVQAGIYTASLTVSRSSGGTASTPVTVSFTVNSLPVLTITDPQAVCAPSTVDLTASAVTSGSSTGLTYSYYSDTQGTVALANPSQINASGTYYIKASNSSGCSVIQPVQVVVNSLPVLIITNPQAVCAPSTVDLTVPDITSGSSTGLTYSYYSDTQGTVALATPSQISISGTYYIKASNASGCSVILPVNVSVIQLPVAAIITGDNELCVSGTVSLNSSATGGVWNSSNTSVATIDAAGKITALSAGQTEIIYTLGNSCGNINSQPFTVTVNAIPALNQITGPTELSLGEQVVLNINLPGGNWQSSDMAVINIDANGTVKGIKEGAAIITYSINTPCGVLISSPFTISVNNSDDLFIPNAFTPNGDGNNDEFKVYGSAIGNIDLKIFNQWGELIYQATDTTSGWTGVYKGEEQPAGVYVYTAKLEMLNGQQIVKKGAVNLIR